MLLTLLSFVLLAMTSAHTLKAEAEADENTGELKGISKRLSRYEQQWCINRCRNNFERCGAQKPSQQKRKIFLRCCVGPVGFVDCVTECGVTSVR